MIASMLNDSDRRKIATEINSAANKIAQQKYLDRVKQLVINIKSITQEDISGLLPKNK